MADWQKVQLSDNPTLTAIAETGTQAIGTVNAALEVVKAAGEAAKLFLLGTVNPAALALILLADQLIAALQNFRESGLFVVQVNPFQQPYGLKNTNDIGLEMQRDSQGLVIFNESKVTAPRSISAFSGQTFKVNDEYRKSLDLKGWEIIDKYNNNINFSLKIVAKNDIFKKGTFKIPEIN